MSIGVQEYLNKIGLTEFKNDKQYADALRAELGEDLYKMYCKYVGEYKGNAFYDLKNRTFNSSMIISSYYDRDIYRAFMEHIVLYKAAS